jgi:ribosomal protein S18 acetylase RimI-like enzyme
MQKIITRRATLDDLDTLLVFEQGVIAAERPFDSTLRESAIRYYDLKHMIEASHIELLVAVSGDKIIGSGYARIETAKPFLQYEQYAYLGFMYVLPEYRGKGVNRMIIDALASWAAGKNITELRLEVYQNNAAAISAYEKAGFQKLLIEMRKDIKIKR